MMTAPMMPGPAMTDRPRGVIKRSIAIAGHRTSISLEEPFWEELAPHCLGAGYRLAETRR